MIYHSDEKIDVWQKNVMMLDMNDDLGYLYVTRNTYDQAVILNDRFGHDASTLRQRLGGPDTQNDIVEFMSSVLPEPLSILAPFYHLIGEEVKLDVDNIHQVVGTLSYISMSIDFNSFLKVPHEVRASLSYTKSILFDFLPSYEDFTFKLSVDSGHIYMRGENADSRDNSEQSEIDSRSSRKNFDITEKTEAKEDYDAVIQDIENMWADLPLPNPIMPTTEEKAPIEEKEQKVGEAFTAQQTQASAYTSIIEGFSI